MALRHATLTNRNIPPLKSQLAHPCRQRGVERGRETHTIGSQGLCPALEEAMGLGP